MNRGKATHSLFSVAPMMDWTDRHCRFFHRQLSARVRLYTEMLTTGAVLFGDRQRLLGFHPSEHPVALQLGGSDPADLARAAEIGAGFGYDEINLNCGCPSDRVQQGRFGACLMAEPELVAECWKAMNEAVGGSIPITIKCRIGIDEQDSEEDLARFVGTVASAGCRIFVIHARKAWLQGLSPKENRAVPPLDYDRVYRLKQANPDLVIILNGGIVSLDEAKRHLEQVDGVMLGRAAYQHPNLIAELDRALYGDPAPVPAGSEVIARMIPYAEAELAAGTRLSSITRHMMGLMDGKPGARAWRRYLAEEAVRPGAGIEILCHAQELARAAENRIMERSAA